MKLKFLVGVLIILIAINLATIGSYLYTLRKHGDRMGPRPPLPVISHPKAPDGSGFERPGLSLMRKLSRSERDQLKELLFELRMETEGLRTAIHSMESHVIEALKEDSIPLQRVDSLLEEISRAHLQVSRRATNKLIEAKTHLSPEQQALFYDAILQAHGYGRGDPGMKGIFRDGKRRSGRHERGRDSNKNRSE